MTIAALKNLKETENKVEFKEAKNQYNYNGGRKCILSYIVAIANEGGGYLVLGMKDEYPHTVIGTKAWEGREGELEQKIYHDLSVRVRVEVQKEESNRVLIITIPSRPIGKPLYFEDIPLMRVGDELKRMSDEMYRAIINEQEPDFSATFCDEVSINDLDVEAIQKMKAAYAEKQNNPSFLTLSDEQALSDLDLMQKDKITNAAVILLGKKESIEKWLPQAAINLEYRNNVNQIVFDNRQIFGEGYFIAIDKVWNLIDLRNGKVPVQQGAFIFDIPYFNKEVIREALNNAVAHRDYRKNSEIVIKQFPYELHMINPGGFPMGVTLSNLLTVNSTPRNRLLADVMAKTGVVERSGQGIDKIFFQTLSEAKPEPDYSYSDNYQVELRLNGLVEDKAFAIFIKKIQQARKDDEKLSVQEVLALNKIRKESTKNDISPLIIKKLEVDGLIEKVGNTNAQKLILSKTYYSITGKQGEYTHEKPLESYQINMLVTQYLEEFKMAKMKDFVALLKKFLTREQVKYKVEQMVKSETLEQKGKGSATFYIKGRLMEENAKIAQRVVELGIEEMKKRGEW